MGSNKSSGYSPIQASKCRFREERNLEGNTASGSKLALSSFETFIGFEKTLLGELDR